MKTTISIPNDVFETAEAFARRHHLSRSALYTCAIEEYLQRHGRKHSGKSVTAQLNRVYGEQSSALDPVLARLQVLALPDDTW